MKTSLSLPMMVKAKNLSFEFNLKPKVKSQLLKIKSPSRRNNQTQATSQANTSRPRTRQQTNIEAQAQEIANMERPSSPIRRSRLFEKSNDEQININSEDDGEPLPMQDTHITREQAITQAQDVGTPHLAPQQPQVKRVNRTLAHPSDLIIGNPSQ